MEMNSYQALKMHLFTNLQHLPQPLEIGTIDNEIHKLQDVIELFTDKFGPEIGISQFHNISPSLSEVKEIPTDIEWDQIKDELEGLFNVKMERGVLIQGDENANRDKFWWTNKDKSHVHTYYWNRYSNQLLKVLNKQVRNKIDETTDVIMNQIGDPDENKFERRGMVVGHVQSGKTAHYSSLICKAADAGYKFIVVIAGDKNNLRNQTQKRLNEHFVGWEGTKTVGVGIGDDKLDKRPISLTSLEKDFNKQDADRASQGSNFDNVIVPILIVIKKNTRTLTNVTSWLRNQYKNLISNHAMLLIDDESDYGSINTKEEDSPTTINKKIRELLSLFEKTSYVAYTATPYANILIDHEAYATNYGEDLFPKDFIYALEAPTNYMGAYKVFIENPQQNIVQINDYLDVFPMKHKKDLEVFDLPQSLKEAIRLFLINIAVRDLRGYSKEHNSMLIHATRFTNVHQQIAFHVTEYLDKIKRNVLSYGSLENWNTQSQILRDLNETYNKFCHDIEFSWNPVKHQIVNIIETVLVREVHQRTPQHLRLQYSDDERINVIAIGGASLSRGYTLEGLSVSYFLRNSIYYDTLMQMGRWFGYREGYDDICKIFIPKSIKDNFTDIIESTVELYEDFRRMADDNLTPKECGLAIRYRPESALQVTARNKQQNAEDLTVEMKLDGTSKETARIHIEKSKNQKNKQAIVKLLEEVKIEYKKDGNTYVWKNVPATIIFDFVNNYNFIPYDRYSLNSRMPIDFIKKYIVEVDTNWDIALFSGTGTPVSNLPSGVSIKRATRQIEKLEDGNKYYEILGRKISTGNPEKVVLSEEVKNSYKKISSSIARANMERPLLMLYFLELDVIPETTFPAIGFSFPTNHNGPNNDKNNNLIRLKINTVYQQQLEDELMWEEDGDD